MVLCILQRMERSYFDSFAGPIRLPGAVNANLGHTHLDRMLRIVPKPPVVTASQLQVEARLFMQDVLVQAALHFSLSFGSMDVSLVDHRPQELLLLSLDDLTAEHHAGSSAGERPTAVDIIPVVEITLAMPACKSLMQQI